MTFLDESSDDPTPVLDVKVGSLLSNIFSGHSSLLTSDEMRLACNVRPLINALWRYCLHETFLSSVKNASLHEVDCKGKRCCTP